MEKKQCEVNIKFSVPKEKIQHVYNARDELAKAGISFDTGGYSDGDLTTYDWEFDWSLKGGVEVFLEGIKMNNKQLSEHLYGADAPKQCLKCQAVWPGSASFCGYDGEKLILKSQVQNITKRGKQNE